MTQASKSNVSTPAPAGSQVSPPGAGLQNASTSNASVPSTAVASNLETANLIEGYHVIAEWIRFADAKAAVILTVGGAIAGLVIPTLKGYLAEKTPHPTPWWTTLVSALFALWLLLTLLSGIWSFRCILPFRRKGRHPALGTCQHFHPAAISAAFTLDDTHKFMNEVEALGDVGLRKEVSACLLIDSHISGAKYHLVSRSIRLMGLSAIVALLYLIAIQF